jgi:hypothetical protein
MSFGIAFLMFVANGPVSSFIPIIVDVLRFNTLNSLLLSMPAGICSGTTELLVPLIAGRTKKNRTWSIVTCELGTIIASLLLWKLPRSDKHGLLFACYILASFGGGYAVLMDLSIANIAGCTKRSVTSSGLFIEYCIGNIVGPLVFR